MTLKIQELYKYSKVIQGISSAIGGGGQEVVLSVESAEFIPVNSVVRFNSENKLAVARNVVGQETRIAGFTVLGAPAYRQCVFYPSGSVAPFLGTVGCSYFLDANGNLSTLPVHIGSPACIRVGYTPHPSYLAVDVSTFYL